MRSAEGANRLLYRGCPSVFQSSVGRAAVAVHDVYRYAHTVLYLWYNQMRGYHWVPGKQEVFIMDNHRRKPAFIRLNEMDKARKLARSVSSGGRRRPAVVASQPNRTFRMPVDLDALAARLGDGVDVFLLGRDVENEFNAITGRPVYDGAIAVWTGGRRRYWTARDADIETIAQWLGAAKPTEAKPQKPGDDIHDSDTSAPATVRKDDVSIDRGDDDGAAGLPDSSDWFADERERWDFDIRFAWARRVPASAKGEHPLPAEWRYSPGFAIPRNAPYAQAIEAMADALDGMDASSGKRRLHRVRSKKGGASCWRQGEAGRPIFRSVIAGGHNPWMLHYTRLDDGTISFVDVPRHDDIREER